MKVLLMMLRLGSTSCNVLKGTDNWCYSCRNNKLFLSAQNQSIGTTLDFCQFCCTIPLIKQKKWNADGMNLKLEKISILKGKKFYSAMLI